MDHVGLKLSTLDPISGMVWDGDPKTLNPKTLNPKPFFRDDVGWRLGILRVVLQLAAHQLHERGPKCVLQHRWHRLNRNLLRHGLQLHVPFMLVDAARPRYPKSRPEKVRTKLTCTQTQETGWERNQAFFLGIT